jgi:hypothetical protein
MAGALRRETAGKFSGLRKEQLIRDQYNVAECVCSAEDDQNIMYLESSSLNASRRAVCAYDEIRSSDVSGRYISVCATR